MWLKCTRPSPGRHDCTDNLRPLRSASSAEFALAAAIDIAGLEDVLVFSAGTDGTDGPTDAAGAMADGHTCQRAEKQGLEAKQFLANNDSYNFFRPLDDLVITGTTNTNVMDVRLILVAHARRRK